MKINQIKVLYSLLFKSSNSILKISIALLPIFIAISFASILFINNLSQSYKDYLLKSYIGVQGVLTIKSKDINYLNELKNKLKQSDIKSSLKKSTMQTLILDNNKFIIEKNISLVILEKSYLKDKFGYKNEAIVINNVLKNILGDTKILKIKSKNNNKSLIINDVDFIDTGFLISEPLIFISKEFYNSLKLSEISFNKLEIDLLLSQVDIVKKRAYKLADIYKSDMDTEDILSSHKQTQNLFNNIKYIEYIILSITTLLSFIILTGALSVISKIKAKAISLLRIYGLSTNLISISLTFMSGVLLSLSLFLAYIILALMKIYFIQIIGLDSEFFLAIDNKIILLILSIVVIFLAVTYIWAFRTFKGKIEI